MVLKMSLHAHVGAIPLHVPSLPCTPRVNYIEGTSRRIWSMQISSAIYANASTDCIYYGTIVHKILAKITPGGALPLPSLSTILNTARLKAGSITVPSTELS